MSGAPRRCWVVAVVGSRRMACSWIALSWCGLVLGKAVSNGFFEVLVRVRFEARLVGEVAFAGACSVILDGIHLLR